jgi:hypothetical protein
MSTFMYGGILLEPCETIDYDRRVRMDGFSYLWTEHTLTVQGLYNPFTTSYAPGAGGDLVQFQAGSNPAFTDSAVRHRLCQPRQKLVYSSAGRDAAGKPALFQDGFGGGSLLVLDVPFSQNAVDPEAEAAQNGFYQVDACNGPVVVGNPVVRASGTKTWHVRVTVRVCLNECFNFYSSPTVLLSHKWSETQSIDQDHFVRRTIRGHAIFRTDVLLANAWRPDDFRKGLIHPLPAGMRRVALDVTPDENNNRLNYVVVDQEDSHTLKVKNVTRIECFATILLGRPAAESAFTGFVKTFLGGLKNFGNVAGWIEGLVPKQAVRLTVRVWGNRLAKRKSLAAVATRILQMKVLKAINGYNYGSQFAITLDQLGRFVEINATFTSGPISTLADVATGKLATRWNALFDDEMGDIASGLPVDGVQLPNGSNTRGTYTRSALAQSNGSSCQPPGIPVNSPAVDRQIPGVS